MICASALFAKNSPTNHKTNQLMNANQTRRQFINTTGTALAGAGLGLALGPRAFAQSKGANDKIVFGLIGCGGMGRANMNKFVAIGGSEIAAVCDVDEKHMDE